MKKWEYKIFSVNCGDSMQYGDDGASKEASTSSKTLTFLGSEGWELVSTILIREVVTFYLKREKQ